MQSGRQQRKTAWVIRVPLSAVSAYNATLGQWFKNVDTLPIYMLVRSPDLQGATMSPQGIISKLREIYDNLGVVFSVVSERKGRTLISASYSNTKAERGKAA